MLSKIIFAATAFLCAGQALGHGSHDHSHSDETAVQVLTEGTFHDTVKDQPLTLVEFFAPWCGHCKSLAPHYASASIKLQENESTAKLASVDCTVEKSLCEEYGIKGFPTLKVFTPTSMSSPSDYKGGRTSDDIVNYMIKQSQPAYIEVADAEAGDKFLSSNPTSVKFVGVFSSLSDDSAQAFKEVAQHLRNDYSFALSADPSYFSKLSLTKPSVTVVKAGDESASMTEEPFTAASIDKFIQSEAFPLFGEIGPDNYQKYVDRGLALSWVFYDPSASDLAEQNKIITEAARAVKGLISVVKLDGVKWAEHMKHFDLPNKLPGIVIEDRESGRKFHFPADVELSVSSLTKHFQGFLDGSVQPNMKSEAVPESNDGPVRVIVGSTFDAEVVNSEKDVFVEFYAPWCGHCKSLAPKWEELGEIFADNDDVVIAKVDATANDTPARVEGFPTLIFYPKGAKSSPVKYEGDRTPQAMAEWIRAHGGSFGNAAGRDDL